MTEIKVAMAFIGQGNRLLFQERRNTPNTGEPGKVGCFGGKIETGESKEHAAVRELSEETSHKFKPDDLKYLGEVNVTVKLKDEAVAVNAQVFITELPKQVNLVAEEGRLVSYSELQASKNCLQMTEATRAAFKKFILKQEA